MNAGECLPGAVEANSHRVVLIGRETPKGKTTTTVDGVRMAVLELLRKKGCAADRGTAGSGWV